MYSSLPFLLFGACHPREVDGPVGEEGAAREDEGAPLEDDAPGAEADEGGYAPGKGPDGVMPVL